MKLDVTAFRFLGKEEMRVLVAIEMGMRNHDVVPVPLIASIAGFRHGGTHRAISIVHKHKLVFHEGAPVNGYRLTYLGYDFLALYALTKRGVISAVGRQIGVGKESDVFLALDGKGQEVVLKLHRLGRTSFRKVKDKRDYLGGRKSFGNWLYLSRLSATKEYSFLTVLHEHGFPVPIPYDHNRHIIVMSKVDGVLLASIRELTHPGRIYAKIVDIVTRLAQHGLVHCDCNEFNLMLSHDESKLTLIDFPQMISTSHINAPSLFERDINEVVNFFTKKIGFAPQNIPRFVDFAPPLLPEDYKQQRKELRRMQKHEEEEEKEVKEGKMKEDKIEDDEDEEDEIEEEGNDEEGDDDDEINGDEENNEEKEKMLEKDSSSPSERKVVRLDYAVSASGFCSKQQEQFERMLRFQNANKEESDDEEDSGSDEDDEEEEEEGSEKDNDEDKKECENNDNKEETSLSQQNKASMFQKLEVQEIEESDDIENQTDGKQETEFVNASNRRKMFVSAKRNLGSGGTQKDALRRNKQKGAKRRGLKMAIAESF